jgi:2-polyprenyl-6-hydroxyphenyl methylase / 3-demethylubiquinone-9 3-methyltransferase
MPTTQNIDPKETDFFSDLADQWWDKEGPMKPLHVINPCRLTFIQEHCHHSAPSTLDVGCGAGILTEAMAALDWQVDGIDASEKMIIAAKNHAKLSNLHIRYLLKTAEQAAKQKKRYDVITCLELIEHVPDPASLVKALHTLLKPGGRVFISTINRNPLAFLGAIVAAEYILGMLPKGTHQYEKFIQPSELDRFARQAGLSLKKISGMLYNPLTHTAELSSFTAVNYICCYEKTSKS